MISEKSMWTALELLYIPSLGPGTYGVYGSLKRCSGYHQQTMQHSSFSLLSHAYIAQIGVGQEYIFGKQALMGINLVMLYPTFTQKIFRLHTQRETLNMHSAISVYKLSLVNGLRNVEKHCWAPFFLSKRRLNNVSDSMNLVNCRKMLSKSKLVTWYHIFRVIMGIIPS